MLKVADGIKTQWETHSRGHSPACSVVTGSTVPEKSESRETPGDGRRVGPRLTVIQSLRAGQRVGLCEKPDTC